MYTFTIIDNVKSRKVLANVTASQFAALTANGGGFLNVPNYRPTIEAIRISTDEEEQKRLKMTLPAALVSCKYTGEFAFKNDAYDYVPLMQLDFDIQDNGALKNPGYVSDILEQLNKLGHCAFKSPRGGIKMIIPITTGAAHHNQAYEALNQLMLKLTGFVGDENCAGVVRTMFMSFDRQCRWVETTPRDPFAEYVPSPKEIASTSHVRWEDVDTSSAEKLFSSVIKQLEVAGVTWTKGKHNEFLMGVAECKKSGLDVGEIIKLTHAHIAGAYRCDYTKEFVTFELTRMFANYFGKGLTQAVSLYKKEVITFTSHLSEHTKYIYDELRSKKVVYIDAPTGSGKTYMIAELARLAGSKVDLLMPTTALAMQQHNPELGIISSTGDRGLTPEQKQALVLATCYESVAKASKREAGILVIDEAHELATSYSYRSKTIQTIQRYQENYKYVIFLSGSMFPIRTHSASQHILRFAPLVPKLVEYSLVSTKKASDADYFVSTIESGKLNVFYKNNKEELLALEQVLKKKGLKVAVVTADNKEDDGYVGIVQNSTLAGYDVLLTTCLIQAGVNLNDEIGVNIVFAKGATLMDYIQFVARFRRVKPSVRICHCGELGVVWSDNTAQARVFLQSLLVLYNQAAAANKGLEYGEHSYLKMAGAPDGVMAHKGGFKIDEFHLLHQKYQVATSSAGRNTKALHTYLQQHNFVEVGGAEVDSLSESGVKEAKQEGRCAAQEKVDAIIEKLFNHTLTPKTKLEKDIRQRFDFLVEWLDKSSIKTDPAMLTKQAEYNRQHNRIAYQVCQETVAKGQALREETQVRYNKLVALEKLFTPGQVMSVAAANAAVTTIYAGVSVKAVRGYLEVVYSIARKRVRAGDELTYVYLIGEKHRLKPKASGDSIDQTLKFLFPE